MLGPIGMTKRVGMSNTLQRKLYKKNVQKKNSTKKRKLTSYLNVAFAAALLEC